MAILDVPSYMLGKKAGGGSGTDLPVYVINDNSEQNPLILSEIEVGTYLFTNIEVSGLGGLLVYVKASASDTSTSSIILPPGLPFFTCTKKIQDVMDYEAFIFYGGYFRDENGQMAYSKTEKTPWGLTNDFGTSSLFTDIQLDALARNLSGYDSSKTQVLKNVNGSIMWVDE